jgi:polyferredoxin
MARIGRAPGLVRYASEVQLSGQPRRILRPRTVLYAAILLVLCGLFAWRLGHRPEVQASVLRQRVLPVFEADPDGRDCIRAVVPVALLNTTAQPVAVRLELPPELAARVVLPGAPVELPPGSRRELTPIIYLPHERVPGRQLATVLRVLSADGRVLAAPAVTVAHP